jgi:hypothetical protein
MTLEAVKTIKLVRVDADDLQDVEDIPEAVRFSVELDTDPSPTWVQEFVTAYGLLHYAIKPPVEVTGNRIWIAYLPRYAGELQAYINFLKIVIERANTEEQRTLQMHEHDNTSEKARFRELLRGVRL